MCVTFFTHLWWLDADVLVQLWVREGQLNRLLDFLHLLLKTTHVRIALQGSLLHLFVGDTTPP